MESTLTENTLVVALGGLGVVKRLFADGRIEIELKKDRSRHVVLIDDIEIITSADVNKKPIVNTVSEALEYQDLTVESSEQAQKRFLTLKSCFEKIITIDQAASELSISKSQIYKLLKNFTPRAGVYSVIKHKRGRKKGIVIISGPASDVIDECIKKYYKGEGATASNVHSKVVDECSEKGIAEPSLSTVQRRIRKISPLDKLTATHGSEVANDKLGLKSGSLKTSRPLEVVQADHTRGDVLLCDEKFGGKPLRPWLTIIIDSYTRVILGFYFSLHAPSAVSLSVSLTMSCLPKADFLKVVGATSATYPFFGKPEKILVDNAAEFRSAKFIKACSLNNIEISWRPMGKKHWGGIIERAIGTFMRKMHQLPGTTMSGVKERPKGEIKASMTFSRLLAWFTLQVEQYHNTPHRGLGGKSPANVWFEHFSNDKGEIRYPPILDDPFKFRLDFMPEERRSISSRGIEFKKQYYSSPALALHVGKKNVVIKYDPMRMKKIWAFLDGAYVEATYDITLPDMTMGELNIFNKSTHQERWLARDKAALVNKEATEFSAKHQLARRKDSYEVGNQFLRSQLDDFESDESSNNSNNFVPSPYKVWDE